MSWLTGGSLRLTGTTKRVVVGRVTVRAGYIDARMEVAGSGWVSTKEGISGPSTSSAFLRNLQFDVEAVSRAGCAEWNGRVRNWTRKPTSRAWNLGTPLLLGHIHVSRATCYFTQPLSGARGDINFANPFPARSWWSTWRRAHKQFSNMK